MLRPIDPSSYEQWHDYYEPRPAKEPTHHQPGSPEKIEVMRERAENGEHLYHRHDETQCRRGPREGEMPRYGIRTTRFVPTGRRMAQD